MTAPTKLAQSKDSFVFTGEGAHDQIREIIRRARKLEKNSKDGDIDYSIFLAGFSRELINDVITAFLSFSLIYLKKIHENTLKHVFFLPQSSFFILYKIPREQTKK